MENKDFIINNLNILLAAVEAQPETLFDLSHYKQETPCGTLFCTAGLATTIPHFQKLGMDMLKEGYFVGVAVNGRFTYKGSADHIFGPHSSDNLFEPAGCGGQDDEIGYEVDLPRRDEDGAPANMTDKELAIARLKHQIAAVKAA